MTVLRLVVSNYQNLSVTFTEDGWFNATEIASKFGKEAYDWLRQRDTAEYISTLLDLDGNTGFLPDFNRIKGLDGSSAKSRRLLLALVKKTGYVRTKSGSPENGGGTWLHPDLGVLFARWLDIKFAIWCDRQIKALIAGSHPHHDVKRMRHAASSSYKVMSQMLQMTRQNAGKEIAPHHFSNEARLINWALLGEFKGVDRDALPYGELDLLAKLEEMNAVLIGGGLGYDARKQALQVFASNWRISYPALEAA